MQVLNSINTVHKQSDTEFHLSKVLQINTNFLTSSLPFKQFLGMSTFTAFIKIKELVTRVASTRDLGLIYFLLSLLLILTT